MLGKVLSYMISVYFSLSKNKIYNKFFVFEYQLFEHESVIIG